MKRMTEEQHYWLVFTVALCAACAIVFPAIYTVVEGDWQMFISRATETFLVLATPSVAVHLLYVYTKPEDTPNE